MRPGMWWAGSQLFPLASYSDPSGRGPVRSARGCLCPQVTGANPGGFCGPSECHAGSRRSLAAASSPGSGVTSPPADRPAAGSRLVLFTVVAEPLPAPPMMCSGVDLGVMPGEQSRHFHPGASFSPGRGACMSVPARGLLPCLPRLLWTNCGQSGPGPAGLARVPCPF